VIAININQQNTPPLNTELSQTIEDAYR